MSFSLRSHALVWAALCLSAFPVGCDRKRTSDAPAAAPVTASTFATASPGAVATPESTENGTIALGRLANDRSNPYLSNNAKAALAAWNQQDFDQSVVYLQTTLSLRLTPDQQASVLAALDGMRTGLDHAARSGNNSAKAALTRLASMNAP